MLGKWHKWKLLELFTPKQQIKSSAVCGDSGDLSQPHRTRPSAFPRTHAGAESQAHPIRGGPAIPGATVAARVQLLRMAADAQDAASCECERGCAPPEPAGPAPPLWATSALPSEGTAFKLRQSPRESLTGDVYFTHVFSR